MSKTVKFEIGDKVRLIVDSEMRRGNIERLHVDLPRPVVVVGLEDGRKVKAYITDITPEPKTEIKEEPEKVQEEPKREPVLKESVTITQKQFSETCAKIIANDVAKHDDSGVMGMFYIMFSAMVEKALFYDAVENE